MATPEAAPAAAPAWCGSAFGLSITADEQLAGIPEGNGGTGGRRVAWRRLETLAPVPVPLETLVDMRHPSGSS